MIYLTEIHYIYSGSMKSQNLFILLLFMLQIQTTYGQGKSNNYEYYIHRDIVDINTVRCYYQPHKRLP